MNIIWTLLLFFVVAVSSTAANPELARASKLTDSPGDGKTEGSPNARLRGALSAEGVYVESDSFGDGEESRFETGAPEFLSCKAIGSVCTYGGHHDYESFRKQCCRGSVLTLATTSCVACQMGRFATKMGTVGTVAVGIMRVLVET